MKLVSKLKQIGNENINFFIDRIEELENKKEIDIVFSGTLSNGKSTLLNAFLGDKILPMALGSTTASIILISNGNNKIVVENKEYELNYQNLEELNKKNEIIEVFSNKIENKNIRLVDTPGINDILEARENKTFNFVPSADAMVFVIDVSKGLTKDEKEFFEKYILKTNKDKVFIVLNKLDLIDEELNISKLLSEEIVNNYKIYPLSSKQALVGKIKNDIDKLKNSRFLEFENDLKEYISNLDKQKIINKRKKEMLLSIDNLVKEYFSTIIDNLDKNIKDVEIELNKVNEELNQAISKKELLEKELNSMILEVKKCIDNNLNRLNENIDNLLKQTNHKEELVEVFNNNLPRLVEETINNIKSCINKDINVNVNIQKLDDLMIMLLTNIDDVLTGFISILTMLPVVGDKVKPFLPMIQNGIRQLADMFGGNLIENKVNEEIKKILNKIKTNSYNLLEDFKTDKLLEYEANELGILKTKIKSLNQVLELKKDKVSEETYKIDFYKKELKEIEELIQTELQNV